MTVFRYPGNLRIGLRSEPMNCQTPSRRMIPEERMILIVLLSGHQRFNFGQSSYLFSTLQPHDPGPKAILLNFKPGDCIEYLESVGTPLVKISVSFDAKWLAQAGTLIEEPASPDLRHVEVAALPEALTARIFSPDPEMIAIAEDIQSIDAGFHAGIRSRNAMNLALMSRGIDLLSAALAQIGTLTENHAQSDQANGCDPRLERLTTYIAAHLERADWGPEELARACGLGIRSLQRLCRTQLGCSPSAFIRTQRMQAAFTALSHRRMNLQQAAYVAGYSNTGNFSTAFKRAFGVPPSQLHE